MDERRRVMWEWLIGFSLCIGYAGYYICRTDLYVCEPLMLADPTLLGITKTTLGWVISLSVGFYAVGKVLSGVSADFLGGRRLFLTGMIVSIICTVAFGVTSGVMVFALWWSVNRLFQAMGWVSMVKVTAQWFSFLRYGRVLALLSLSYTFGDGTARVFLGHLIKLGWGWRGLFFVSAALLGAIAVFCTLTIKQSPLEVGLSPPPVNPNNVYGEHGSESRPSSLADLLQPLLGSLAFWLVMIMSCGLTLIRETFNAWSVDYLVSLGFAKGDAAQWSSIFPFVGGISILVTGFVSDYLRRRSLVMLYSMVPLVGVLVFMGYVPAGSGVALPVTLMGLTALLLIGPYSFLGGAMAADLGGKRGSSTIGGLIDSAGYLGGMVAGGGIGSLTKAYGWSAGFDTLAAIAAATLVATALYYFRHERHLKDNQRE